MTRRLLTAMWHLSLPLALIAGAVARGEDRGPPDAGPGRQTRREASAEVPALTQPAIERWYDLADAASAALEAGNTDEARRDAEELVAGAKGRETNWNYGNAIHDGNVILGRIALEAGDVSKAKEHLIAAGKTSGSPQLDTFGPDLKFAEQLLDKGEGKTVAEYLRLVSKFCKPMKPRLDAWATAIDNGGRPRMDRFAFSGPRDGGLPARIVELFSGAATLTAHFEAELQRLAMHAEQVGKPFELTFTDAIGGKEISVQKDLKGKVVVVDFWATWCPPCVRAVPGMKKLYAQYKDKGVEFIGVSLDLSEADGGLAALKEFVSKNGITWPQYYQGEGDLSSRWAVSAIPTLFVIDADGKLASADARGNIEKLIPELIAKRDRRPAARATPALQPHASPAK